MNVPLRHIERHPIESREQWLDLRKQDVTASVAGALLGVHDYATAYGLWALKSGKIAEDPEETGAMKRGRLLEPVAAALIQEQHPDWKLERPGAYYRDPLSRIGATPDLFAANAEGRGVIQIKTVEPGMFRRVWRDADTGDARPPLWIAVQAIIEAHLTGAKWAAVGALIVGYGIDLHVVPVPIHEGVIDRIKEAVADFWRQVESGKAPAVDYGRDGAVLAELYAQDNGATIDLSGDNRVPVLLAEDEALAASLSEGEKRRREIKNELIDKMGAATFATVQGWKLSAKTINRKGYAVAPSSYRQVRSTRLEPKE